MPRTDNLLKHSPLIRKGWLDLLFIERLTVIFLLVLTTWGLIQIILNYPSSFFPRFSDEAVYALDVAVPSSIFDDFQRDHVRYAPAKFGYGLPLAAAAAVFGRNGPMYISTLFWMLTVGSIAFFVLKRFGLVPCVAAVTLVSYSPVFGKYVVDVGPTTEAAFAFIVLWAFSGQRRFWVSGLAIAFVAFVDFKWALPAAGGFVLLKLLVDQEPTFKKRVIHICLAGITAIGILGLVMILHSPFAEYWYDYVLPHSQLAGFEPSMILFYYFYLFGALPVIAVSGGSLALGAIRVRVKAIGQRRLRMVLSALILSAIPIAFHSVFGIHKALRFFAALFPLLMIPVSVLLSLVLSWVADRLQNLALKWNYLISVCASLMFLALVHGGSQGPAHQMTLAAGFEPAMAQLLAQVSERGTISSYNYLVIMYGWPIPAVKGSFAFVGLLDTDRWIALDHMHDRATVDLRVQLERQGRDPDSLWTYQTNVYRRISDSLFSVNSDFYASDYFLCEMVTHGIRELRRLQSYRQTEENHLTIYQVNFQKLQVFQASKR